MSSCDKWFHSALRKDLNLYEILLLEVNATPREIRQSYEHLRNLWSDGSGEREDSSEGRRELIEKAYHVLIDPRLRQQYDDFLAHRSCPAPIDSESETEAELLLGSSKNERPLKSAGKSCRSLWVVLLLVAGSMFLLWSLWPQDDLQQELAVLRQLYPPPPKRMVPPDSPEREDHSALFRSRTSESEESKSAAKPTLLMHEQSFSGRPYGQGMLSSSRTAGRAGLLRDEPIREHSGVEPSPSSNPDFRANLLHPSPMPHRESGGTPGAAFASGLNDPEEVPQGIGDLLDAFQRQFAASFEKRDWKALNDCYATHAVENGELWLELKSGYRERFEKAERILYGATIRNWNVQENGLVVVWGEFQRTYENKDGSLDHSKGGFRWTLKESEDTLKLVEVKTRTSGDHVQPW